MTTTPEHHQRWRLRVGAGWPPSKHVGVVIDIITHGSNGRTMFRMLFDDPGHQGLFGDCCFYGDDIEEVR